jgi:hypothetical protein
MISDVEDYSLDCGVQKKASPGAAARRDHKQNQTPSTDKPHHGQVSGKVELQGAQREKGEIGIIEKMVFKNRIKIH